MPANGTEIFVYRTWKLRVIGVLALLVIPLGGWQLYSLGKSNADTQLTQLGVERDRLKSRVEDLDLRNVELDRQVIMLERTRQIDQQAYAEIKAERTDLSAEIQTLSEELAFYRGVMSPEKSQHGLRLQDFEVEQAPGEQTFRFSMVLAQVKRRRSLVRGVVHLQVEGIQNGALKNLPLSVISESKEIVYRFRYFQAMEGNLKLPDDFEPRVVYIQVIPAGKKRTQLEWTFDWPSNLPVQAGEN